MGGGLAGMNGTSVQVCSPPLSRHPVNTYTHAACVLYRIILCGQVNVCVGRCAIDHFQWTTENNFPHEFCIQYTYVYLYIVIIHDAKIKKRIISRRGGEVVISMVINLHTSLRSFAKKNIYNII